MIPRFRVDDVLQTTQFSTAQLEMVAIKPFFSWFKEAVAPFENDYLKLAVVAEGILVDKEWIDYIKAHPNWEVQCHGMYHTIMSSLPEETVYQELKQAKELIEDTFGQKVTQFYPPKHYESENIYRACRRLRLSVMLDRDIPENWFEHPNMREVYWHFWNPKQNLQVKEILNAQSG